MTLALQFNKVYGCVLRIEVSRGEGSIYAFGGRNHNNSGVEDIGPI